jgi:Na+-translocating ferredoxin:NAD+ oxidoreductase RNF subunit RnfB
MILRLWIYSQRNKEMNAMLPETICPKCGAQLEFGGDFDLTLNHEASAQYPAGIVEDAGCAACGWEGSVHYKIVFVKHDQPR